MFFYILEIFIAILFVKTLFTAPLDSDGVMLKVIVLHFYLVGFLVISVGHVIYDKIGVSNG